MNSSQNAREGQSLPGLPPPPPWSGLDIIRTSCAERPLTLERALALGLVRSVTPVIPPELDAEQRAAYVQHLQRAGGGFFPGLSARYGQPLRTSSTYPCPLCGDDWCVTFGPPARLGAILCMWIEDGASFTVDIDGHTGYVHELPGRDIPAQRPSGYRTAAWLRTRERNQAPEPAKQPARSLDEWRSLQAAHVQSLRNQPGLLEEFADALGVNAIACEEFGVGWSQEYQAFTSPMTDQTGAIIGIQVRTLDGAKWSIPGTSNGLFLPSFLWPRDGLRQFGTSLLIICEGLSDALVAASWGYAAVAKHNCSGQARLLVELCRRLQPAHVAIVPDNDENGLEGGKKLQKHLAQNGIPTDLLQLPSGVIDLREAAARGMTAQHFASLLAQSPNRSLSVSIPGSRITT